MKILTMTILAVALTTFAAIAFAGKPDGAYRFAGYTEAVAKQDQLIYTGTRWCIDEFGPDARISTAEEIHQAITEAGLTPAFPLPITPSKAWFSASTDTVEVIREDNFLIDNIGQIESSDDYLNYWSVACSIPSL